MDLVIGSVKHVQFICNLDTEGWTSALIAGKALSHDWATGEGFDMGRVRGSTCFEKVKKDVFASASPEVFNNALKLPKKADLLLFSEPLGTEYF